MTLQYKLEEALRSMSVKDCEEFGFEFAHRDGSWGASPVLRYGSEEINLKYIAGSDSEGFIVFQVEGDESESFYQLSVLSLYDRFIWMCRVDVVEPRVQTVYKLVT